MSGVIVDIERNAESNVREQAPSRLELLAFLLLIANLGLAAPLLDLLGRNAEFFVAHDATPVQIVAFALVWSVVIPIFAWVIVQCAHAVDPRLGRLVRGVTLLVFCMLWVAQILNESGVGGLSPMLFVIATLLVSAGIVVLYLRAATLRRVLMFGFVAPILVLGTFLFGSAAQALVMPEDADSDAVVAVEDPVPVVMVVFDELPLASLVDQGGDIDEGLFPNFARLAAASTWYRNITTVEDHTTWALPAILSGMRPAESDLPVASDHPNAIFRLLGHSHSMVASEPMTRLCPPGLCSDEHTEPDADLSAMLSDAQIVLGHRMLPAVWRTGLPALDQAWANFGEQGDAEGEAEGDEAFEWDPSAIKDDHPAAFRRFIENVTPGAESGRPTLYFHHSVLPHGPWRYLPSGDEYREVTVPGRELPRWGDDEWLIQQAYQRHLLQTQTADRLMGELLDRLRAVGLYDQALIVVTADHGVAFSSDEVIRGARPENLDEVAYVPLFVKMPHQSFAESEMFPGQTIDVVPTVLDVMGADQDRLSRFDGRSLLDGPPAGEYARWVGHSDGERVEVSEGVESYREVARRKYSIFGHASEDEIDLFRLGPGETEALIGRRTDSFPVGPRAAGHVEVENLSGLLSPENAQYAPNLLSGRYVVEDDPTDLRTVAIEINGEIAAVTRTFNRLKRNGFFLAMIPPDRLSTENEVRFLEVRGTGEGEPVLHPISLGEG